MTEPSTGLFYDRQGVPLGLQQWAELRGDLAYCFVAEDWVSGWRISTTWVGADMRIERLEDSPPVIFETMTFPPPDAGGGLDQVRYATEAGAAAGHGRVLAAVLDDLGAGPHEVTTIRLGARGDRSQRTGETAAGSSTGGAVREWRICTDGEKLFSVTGPDAEAMVRAAAAANGGTVSYRDPVRPAPENGYSLNGPPWTEACGTPQLTCPCCGRVTRHPDDIKNSYCGACHWFITDPEPGTPHLQGPCAARTGQRTGGDAR